MTAKIISISAFRDRKLSLRIDFIEPLTNGAWVFAQCALWPGCNFSQAEQEAAKDYIRGYLQAAENKKRAFMALCQRVVLTKRYLAKSDSRYVSLPSVWFNNEYPFGFAGTLSWLRTVEEQRKKVPAYLSHVKALAKGYYRYTVRPDGRQFDKCCEELKSYHADGLLELFYQTIAHLHHYRA